MAARFADLPASVIALPFLLARSRSDDFEWTVRAALSSAIAAERAVDSGRRNTRARLAWLLCELGYQLVRRHADKDAALPVPRVQIAEALGTSLCRVKRTLALLSLSGVVKVDGASLQITDWRRLAGLGGYDPSRLELAPEEAELDAVEIEEAAPRLTAAGDQACFV